MSSARGQLQPLRRLWGLVAHEAVLERAPFFVAACLGHQDWWVICASTHTHILTYIHTYINTYAQPSSHPSIRPPYVQVVLLGHVAAAVVHPLCRLSQAGAHLPGGIPSRRAIERRVRAAAAMPPRVAQARRGRVYVRRRRPACRRRGTFADRLRLCVQAGASGLVDGLVGPLLRAVTGGRRRRTGRQTVKTLYV